MAREIEYVDPKDLTIIGLDTDDRHDHPLFDERVFLPVDENLARNILVYGIQQPVLVRQEAGTTYVVDGRQRVRAARRAVEMQGEAGEHQLKVPTRQIKADDKRVAGIMISTNELRKDDDVLAKAMKAVRLMDQLGDIDEVAIAFGRSKTTIRHWLSLAEADTRVHAAVKAGQLSTAAAIEIARYNRDEQKDVLERLVKGAQRRGEERVSESAAKTDRRDSGESAASDPNSATAGATTKAKPTAKQRAQQGIKRVWLRKALKTDRAKKLTDEQRALLEWFSTGQSEKGTWYDDFVFEAECELNPVEGAPKAKEPSDDLPPEKAAENPVENPVENPESSEEEVASSEDNTEVPPVEEEPEDIAAALAELVGGDSPEAPEAGA